MGLFLSNVEETIQECDHTKGKESQTIRICTHAERARLRLNELSFWHNEIILKISSFDIFTCFCFQVAISVISYR